MDKPKEVYQPGELERTRNNLSEVSREEARELAQKLGGEVGVEKTSEEVEKEYQRLHEKAVEQGEAWESRRRASQFVPASPSYKVVRKTNPLEAKLPRMSWGDRMKTDFLLTKPLYRAKTFGQAVGALTAFFRFVPDTVNPQFIKDGDDLFARRVESLVLAVRGLSSENNKSAHQNLRRIPLYNSIIHVLRDWDVEALNRELTQLQREPRNRSFADFGPLLKPLLRPLFLMSLLNEYVHVVPAVTKMYELARMYTVNTDERDRLSRCYTISREEVPQVFSQLRQRMYPVLLKILSDRFIEPDHFYLEKFSEILVFLGISEKELLQEGPDAEAAVPLADKKEADAVPRVQKTPPSRLASQGFSLLEELFPRAGWLLVAESPDFFGYFQTIVEYQKGADLVPVDDPMQAVMPLSAIIQQLFFGFQDMHWGTIKNQFGEVVHLQEQIDKNISRWHFFMEEFIGKNYLNLLQDYCREVERSGHLAPESKRMFQQLLWLKRNYLLPFLNIPVLEDARPKSLGYPNLAVQVKEMLSLLSPVAAEIEQKTKPLTALLNPDAHIHFPVETAVSIRLRTVLRRLLRSEKEEVRIIDQATNKALLFYTISLLSSLDYLLSNQSSPLYQREQKHLYRTSGLPGDDKPVYNVPKKNTLTLLKKLNGLTPPEAGDQGWQTQLSELYGPFIAQEELKKRVASFHSEHIPFSVVSYGVLNGGPETFLKAANTLRSPTQTVSLQEDGTCLMILPGLSIDEAEESARRVLSSCASMKPPISLRALVIPFQKNWTTEKLLAVPERGRVMSLDIPPQILGIYLPGIQSFEFRSDLPVTQAFKPADPREV